MTQPPSVRDVLPLRVDFVGSTCLRREAHRPSDLPIIGNGPPGTFVLFQDGLSVSLPTDQVVVAEDVDGHAYVEFGGMRFVGVDDEQLVFRRVRELVPEQQLSPSRSHTMRLDVRWVAAVSVDGHPVWTHAMRSDGPFRLP